MLVYLDTNVISGLLENERNMIPDDQLDALEKIGDKDDVNFATSPKLLEEVSKTKEERRKKKLRILFKIIKKVYAPPHTRSFSPLWGDHPFGVPLMESGTLTEEIYSKLIKIFKPDDAEHIYNARKSDCDYFLTLDYDSILKRALKNKEIVDDAISPLKIVDPITLALEF